MKLLLFIVLLTASLSANAFKYYPVGKSGAKETYKNKAACEAKEGQECFDVTGVDVRYTNIEAQTVDDQTKPIHKAPYNTENCDSPEDCGSKMDAKNSSCSNGDYAQYQKNAVLPGYTLFCTGITGYEQKDVKVFVEDTNLKTSVQAADAQAAADKAALKAVKKDAAFGQRMVAYVAARVRAKSLSLADTKTTLSEYSAVMSLLQAGSIAHAKTEITGMTPDGTRISQADKDAILAEINAYLGQ